MLIACPACATQVSVAAAACPSCGHPRQQMQAEHMPTPPLAALPKKGTSVGSVVVMTALALGLLVLGSITYAFVRYATAPEQGIRRGPASF